MVTIKDGSCGCRDFRERVVRFGDMRNCQLRCPYCFTREQKPGMTSLSRLGQMDMSGINMIRFTGGEPLISQRQIDGMIQEISVLEERNPPDLDLVIIQTNALDVKERDLNGLLELSLPVLIEVSLKGTNVREYAYLTFDLPIPMEKAEQIFDRQMRGYVHLVEKFRRTKNILILARLGIFHSSLTRPTFKFVFPDTEELMFNPRDWSQKIVDIHLDQNRIWGKTFEGKLVVEKLKTPADGSPGIGRRYRRGIDLLKSKRLLVEDPRREPLPRGFKERYFYKRADVIYRSAISLAKET